jgi:hypothetical protein
MPIGDPVCSVLWTSQLSPLLQPSAVTQIWRSSRQRNERMGLTGAMVFDGERFCELLEGDVDELSGVCRDIEFDTRHVGMRMLYAEPLTAPRRFAEWRSGYCDGCDLEVFSGPQGLEAEPALKAFLELLPRCALSV